MQNPLVAVHLNRGALYDAMEACTSEIADVKMGEMQNIVHMKGETYAMERARELMWIAGRFARQERWKEARDMAHLSATIFEAPAGTEARLHLNMLAIAGIPEHENVT